jgi:hypothetical protein
MEHSYTFLRVISVIADIITIFGVLIAIRLAILKRYENELAFKISMFLQYMVRTAIIVVGIFLIVYLSNYIYGFLIILLKCSTDVNQYYWEKGKELRHILSYFVTSAFCLPIAWIFITLIWTSSFNLTKDFINLFLPKNKILLKQAPLLEISNATYGTTNKKIDVTQTLRQMIHDNKLTVTASNEIAGDPEWGVVKDLVINYKIGNTVKKITINEGINVTLPEL